MNEFAKKLARYNSTLPSLVDGDLADNLQVDANGRLIITADQALAVSATDLDIRDLSHTQDSVRVGDGIDLLEVNSDGSLNVTVNNASIAVTATDLDIRDLSAAQDNVAISDGTDTLAINADGSINVGNTVTVSATDLDIRDLSSATDSVDLGGNALTALQLIDDLVLAEDAAHVSGEAGVMPLAVRQDVAGSLVDADGDRAPLQVDADGNLRVTGSFDSSVDDVFESGTESDAASDSAGDGIISISNASFSNLATIAVGAGQTLYIVGMDFHADDQSRFELIVDDNGTPSEWIRVGAVDGLLDAHKQFPRAIQITGAANRSVILRAQKIGGGSANAAGAINAYIR